MRGWLLGSLLVLGACAVPAGAPGQRVNDAARKAGWHTDLAKARAEARRANRILFVVFRCQP